MQRGLRADLHQQQHEWYEERHASALRQGRGPRGVLCRAGTERGLRQYDPTQAYNYYYDSSPEYGNSWGYAGEWDLSSTMSQRSPYSPGASRAGEWGYEGFAQQDYAKWQRCVIDFVWVCKFELWLYLLVAPASGMCLRARKGGWGELFSMCA